VAQPALFSIGRTLGFLLIFLLLTICVPPAKAESYCLGVADTIFVGTLVFLAFYAGGLIKEDYGRASYLGESHPNLGAEITAMGVASAAIVYKLRPFMVYCCAAFLTLYFLQGRSALLFLFLIVATYAFNHSATMLRRHRDIGELALIGVCLACLSLFLWSSDTFLDALKSIFLYSDEYRGVATGFAGRDVLWANAWDVFLSAPLTGKGLFFFDEDSTMSPHNFFLYGLSEFGIGAVALWATIVYKIYRISKHLRYIFWILVCFLPLFIFNDRFMNLNIFPLQFYMLMATYYAKIRLMEA
jgi:hypothetical protein